MTDRGKVTVFGLEVEDLPEGWMPVKAVVIIESLDEDGDLAISLRRPQVDRLDLQRPPGRDQLQGGTVMANATDPGRPMGIVRRGSIATAGSLCTGIMGLDLAVADVLGTDLAWVSEIEPAASSIIERETDAPNLGDLTTVDWKAVEPVDVLTAGYPCQPFSHAGKRKGTSDARHLWPHVADAIRTLRPRVVVLENVRGHLTLGFDRVLGDLAEAGFDAEWCLLRASDVGAPHRRERGLHRCYRRRERRTRTALAVTARVGWISGRRFTCCRRRG